MKFIKTSVIHKDIGKHEHEVTIFVLSRVFAVCNLCGMHDWNSQMPRKSIIAYFKEKYPKYTICENKSPFTRAWTRLARTIREIRGSFLWEITQTLIKKVLKN